MCLKLMKKERKVMMFLCCLAVAVLNQHNNISITVLCRNFFLIDKLSSVLAVP